MSRQLQREEIRDFPASHNQFQTTTAVYTHLSSYARQATQKYTETDWKTPERSKKQSSKNRKNEQILFESRRNPARINNQPVQRIDKHTTNAKANRAWHECKEKLENFTAERFEHTRKTRQNCVFSEELS
jgi:hypothetical protein